MSKTLFARLFILFIVLALLGQLATWVVLEWHRLHVLSNQVIEQSLDLLAEAEEHLYRGDEEEIQTWFELNNNPYQIHLRPDQTRPSAAHPPLLSRAIISDLKAVLGRKADMVYTAEPKEQIWVQVTLSGNRYWLVVPLARFHGPPLKPLIVGSLIFIALAAVGSAWFAWRLNRPLRRLAAASEALGKGKETQAVPEEGPEEIRQLAHTFNRMQHDLKTHEQERELWLAGVSHDLRTPLTRLELALALLPDDREHGAMLHDLDDMKRTLQQFVDYARSSQTEASTEIDSAVWLNQVLSPFLSQGVQIEVDAELKQSIKLKPISTGRILSNLIENARRYGKPPVELSLSCDSQRLTIALRDHGPGIPEQEQERLLHPFRRGGSARTADGGCGLGLAIVDRLVRELGGRWSLSNHAQGGLAIRVELPLSEFA